jgi:hypothetical protein
VHNIQATDVTPPAWLNIDSKVVRKIAKAREAIDAVANNRRLRSITREHRAVSVVDPAAAADPQLPGTLQALLNNGEWGNALIGLVQDIRTPIPITTDSIDSIFGWDASVSTAAAGVPSRRVNYAQAIANLLQLPSGVRLFRDIIIAHHCCPRLPKV